MIIGSILQIAKLPAKRRNRPVLRPRIGEPYLLRFDYGPEKDDGRAHKKEAAIEAA